MKKITYRIHEIADVIGGGTPSTTIEEYWNGNIPWITPADLTGYNNVYISNGEKYITELGYKNSSTKMLPKNSLLFSSRAPIGYMAITRDKVCTNQGFKSLVLSDKVDVKYFYYWLKCNLQYIRLFGSGATFPEISGSRMKRIKVEIFEDKTYQKKVSTLLFNYDQLIEINIKRIQILEKIAEDIFKEWFVNFRFPGYENTTFIYDKPSGWILSSAEVKMRRPSEWKYNELKVIAEFKRGKNITAAEMIEGEIPVISAGLEPSGYHNEANVFGKNLTVSSSGANAGHLSYNSNDIWAADCSYYQNDKNIWFVYNTLKFLQPVITNMQVGSAQPHVYAKTINRLSIIIPTEKYIELYIEKVNPIYDQIRLLEKANINLSKQLDALLPKVMSGKINLKGKEII